MRRQAPGMQRTTATHRHAGKSAGSRLASLLLALAGCAGAAQAQSPDLRGYVDLRLVAPANEQDWSDGGLGKTRFGGDRDAAFPGGAALAASFQVTPELLASAELQYLPEARHPLDVLQAWVRYRPVSTTPWRWSTRLGAFFPPISLENDSIGWTSRWTLTPSAINSWVGEELRTIGAELRVEHRGDAGTLTAQAALFGHNDPAGELLAARGWGMGDLTSGLGAVLREPDVYAPVAYAPVPMLYRPFLEIDDRIGWYAGLDWDSPAHGRLALLRYDNRADPTAEVGYAGRELYAWHTRFWSLGAQARAGDVVFIAQLMDGSTAFEPVPGLLLDTRFHAGYLLAGWERGAWQPALRIDLFGLRQLPDTLDAPLDEHGNAITFALNWRPRNNLRLVGELLRLDSTRDQRRLAGLAPRQLDTQVQVAVRVLF